MGVEPPDPERMMTDRDDRSTRDPIEPNDEIEQGEAPSGAPRAATPGLPGHTAPLSTHEQHTRKGQAQSPRELTHNEPPKHKEGHH